MARATQNVIKYSFCYALLCLWLHFKRTYVHMSAFIHAQPRHFVIYVVTSLVVTAVVTSVIGVTYRVHQSGEIAEFSDWTFRGPYHHRIGH